MRVLRHAVCCLILLMPLLVGSGAGAQVDASDQGLDTSVDLEDRELLVALSGVGLLDVWHSASPHSAIASGLTVDGDQRYDELRTAVITDAASLAVSRSDELRLLEAIAQVEGALEILAEVARSQRTRHVLGNGPLDDREYMTVRKLLLQARTSVAHDELAAVLQALDRLRDDLGDHVVAAQRRSPADKHDGATDLSAVLAELEIAASELHELRASASATTAAEQEIVERITATFTEMHERRSTAVSAVDGLPLVTIDAYLRAGEHGVPGCTVDWRLLAGIGRVESIHGTLGGASVAATGRAAPAIFGPLLDGGATEREAEAARQAELEAIRLAEEEVARIAAEERARFESLYGELYRGEASGLDDGVTTDDDPTGGEGDPTTDGDDEDVEDPEDEGNGFAVIEDTDNGSMDGNARWDRAVGPMQFLPGTWRLYGRDGNGDGRVDPHNIYDATAAAADYLCDLERRNGSDPRRFVLGYNESDRYVEAVLAVAAGLERFDLNAERT